MNLIAAVDKNWGIGRDNHLLARIPDDMKRFRRMTTGNIVVMGRKTLESFPDGQPLKNRTNIVLSANRELKIPGAVCVHGVEELAGELKAYDSQDIYIIGGESIYRQLLDWCDTAYITWIDRQYPADAWFPDLNERNDWRLVAEEEKHFYQDLGYTFLKYVRKNG